MYLVIAQVNNQGYGYNYNDHHYTFGCRGWEQGRRPNQNNSGRNRDHANTRRRGKNQLELQPTPGPLSKMTAGADGHVEGMTGGNGDEGGGTILNPQQVG